MEDKLITPDGNVLIKEFVGVIDLQGTKRYKYVSEDGRYEIRSKGRSGTEMKRIFNKPYWVLYDKIISQEMK